LTGFCVDLNPLPLFDPKKDNFTPAPPGWTLPPLKKDGWLNKVIQWCTNSDSAEDRAAQCQKELDDEEKLCVAIAGNRYGGGKATAIRICQAAAAQRYAACLRGTPRESRPPLTGVETPI
jgi:hypothetical protein